MCVYFSSFRELWSKVKQRVSREGLSEGSYTSKISCEVPPTVTDLDILHEKEHQPNNEKPKVQSSTSHDQLLCYQLCKEK